MKIFIFFSLAHFCCKKILHLRKEFEVFSIFSLKGKFPYHFLPICTYLHLARVNQHPLAYPQDRSSVCELSTGMTYLPGFLKDFVSDVAKVAIIQKII
jgi:hypothetical protein